MRVTKRHVLQDVDKHGVPCLIQKLEWTGLAFGWYVEWFDGTCGYILPEQLDEHDHIWYRKYPDAVRRNVYDEIRNNYSHFKKRSQGAPHEN